jgi:hypothetical protein
VIERERLSLIKPPKISGHLSETIRSRAVAGTFWIVSHMYA